MAEQVDAPDTTDYKKKYGELLKEYEEFAYVVSHDLNSPIRHVRHFTKLLLSGLKGSLSDDQKLYAEMIESASDSARVALEGLLEFSQLSTRERNVEKLNMTKLVNGVVSALGDAITEDHAQVSVGPMVDATGDAEMIGEMFSYLIDNAVKFHPPERGNTVDISAESSGRSVIFRIRDNGIGMNPSAIENAMTIFRKLNADEDYPGHGLGLTFARKIADIHGGRLQVESEAGKGTTVGVFLNA